MIDPNGTPYVLEFNCRLGDPETEVILPRMTSDLVPLCLAAIAGELNKIDINWDPRVALGVVLTSGGYPGNYEKNKIISGLRNNQTPDTKTFHAGTRSNNHEIFTDGGRVLCVTALGNTVLAAQQSAYQAASLIKWDNIYYRKDIGYRAIKG